MSHDALEELEDAISQLEVAIKLHENIGILLNELV